MVDRKKIEQVVVITDCSDIAFLEMHQTLRELLPDDLRQSIHIAPMAAVKNFSLVNASFVIRLLADVFEGPGTLFVVVVNGFKERPERIFGWTDHGLCFAGNNSGYFQWLLKDFGVNALYANKTDRAVDGRSFGGKYVQMPTAAKIIQNESPETYGVPYEKSLLKRFEIPDGTVVHVDNFGLMKIKAPPCAFKRGQKLRLLINQTREMDAIYSNTMKCEADGTWVLFQGSSIGGLPELGKIRAQNSAEELGVREGDIITWFPIED